MSIYGNYYEFGESAYVLVEGPSWDEARSSAKEIGGDLVSFNSWDELNFVNNTFVNTSPVNLWIGATDNPNYSGTDGNNLGAREGV